MLLFWVMFIFYGHGANGKSTFIEVLQGVLGPYASKTPMTTLLSTKGEKATHDLARLHSGAGQTLGQAPCLVVAGAQLAPRRRIQSGPEIVLAFLHRLIVELLLPNDPVYHDRSRFQAAYYIN